MAPQTEAMVGRIELEIMDMLNIFPFARKVSEQLDSEEKEEICQLLNMEEDGEESANMQMGRFMNLLRHKSEQIEQAISRK